MDSPFYYTPQQLEQHREIQGLTRLEDEKIRNEKYDVLSQIVTFLGL